MKHPDDDVLLDLALGQPVDVDADSHLSTCDTCTQAVADLRRTADLVRSAGAEVITPPPPAVWETIEAQITRGGSGADSVMPPDRQPAAASGSEPSEPAGATSAPRHRPRPAARWWQLAASCLVGVVIGGTAIAARSQDEPPQPATTVAAAALSTLDTRTTMGTADVVTHNDVYNLQLRTEPVTAGDGYLEVWLINRDLKRMVSIGVIPPGATNVTLPVSRGLLERGFVVVDVSREAFDDRPQHSGDSVMRGTLAV